MTPDAPLGSAPDHQFDTAGIYEGELDYLCDGCTCGANKIEPGPYGACYCYRHGLKAIELTILVMLSIKKESVLNKCEGGIRDAIG